MKYNFRTPAKDLTESLLKIDFENLPISEYNKAYIRRLKPALKHYMNIYACCLERGLKDSGQTPENTIMVDYGGGSGFLSMLAKQIGIKQVIYIDLNPASVNTITLLKEITGKGPDIILQGDSPDLKQWCYSNQIEPHLLIATDLIEHIYDLEKFFSDLISISKNLHMIFTTASTPYNPYVKHKLHKVMKGCETGELMTPNYYTKRKNFIQQINPEIDKKSVEKWAQATRGLIFEDIKIALQENNLPVIDDKYNTCDPESGNWTERILPIESYRNILSPYNYFLKLYKGFYPTDRKNIILKHICRFLNLSIKISGKPGLFIAPFLIFSCGKKHV